MNKQEAYDELSSLYSEACQAFVLRDFDTTTSIVDGLLDRIESEGLGQTSTTSEGTSSSTQLDELVRRVWILQITLLASSDEELARNPKQAERELAGTLSRIERFYVRQEGTATAAATPSTSSSSSTVSILIHPSILVAVSLAGLKLEIPLFVRRALQDYFRLLLSQTNSSGGILSSSQGDTSALDASQADLSLSGIGVNGHHGSAVNGHHGITDGTSTPKAATGNNGTSRIKSLHRLARIYSVLLLGKTLGEWSAARAWIREQADDDAAVAAGLMNDSYAQNLLEALEETKRQQEVEETEAREAEKQEKERQAELLKKNKQQRNSTPSSSQSTNIGPSPSGSSNGQSPPSRSERNKDRTQRSEERAASSLQEASSSSPSDILSRRNAQEQETGFSAFRSHLSNFLSSDSNTSISRAGRNHNSSNDLSRQSKNYSSTDLIEVYLSKIIHSRLLKFLLAFFIITGFWRRRLARSGKRIEIGKNLTRLKEKIVETVKMGGSLGFL